MKDKNKGQDFSYDYQNGWKDKYWLYRILGRLLRIVCFYRI